VACYTSKLLLHNLPEHLPFQDLTAIICCSALFSHSFVRIRLVENLITKHTMRLYLICNIVYSKQMTSNSLNSDNGMKVRTGIPFTCWTITLCVNWLKIFGIVLLFEVQLSTSDKSTSKSLSKRNNNLKSTCIMDNTKLLPWNVIYLHQANYHDSRGLNVLKKSTSQEMYSTKFWHICLCLLHSSSTPME